MPRSPKPAWTRPRLQLKWIVYEDQHGNLTILEPDRRKALGTREVMRRPPQVCIAASGREHLECLEAALDAFDRFGIIDAEHRDLAQRVSDARQREYRQATARRTRENIKRAI